MCSFKTVNVWEATEVTNTVTGIWEYDVDWNYKKGVKINKQIIK